VCNCNRSTGSICSSLPPRQFSSEQSLRLVRGRAAVRESQTRRSLGLQSTNLAKGQVPLGHSHSPAIPSSCTQAGRCKGLALHSYIQEAGCSSAQLKGTPTAHSVWPPWCAGA